jgi:hypothetical protein
VDEEHDIAIDRIADALRPLPTVDESAKARLLVAVAAERERDRERTERRWFASRTARWIGVGGVAAAAAALLLMLLPRQSRQPPVSDAATAAVATANGDVRLVAHGRDDATEAMREPVQLVFRAPAASRVRVVGDFNDWDADRAPMARDASSGLWSVTLSLRPGRHVYAFLVDDTLWMRDPRAPAAEDADFGRKGSVLLVGNP